VSSLRKIAVFIDGPNLNGAARTLGFEIDFRLLLKEFQSRGTLVRAYYYTALIEDPEYSAIRPLVDWLDYNGYTVVTKPSKEFLDESGRRRVKGNMNIELAVEAMEISAHVDEMVLRRWRFSFAGRSHTAPRRPGDCSFDDLHATGNDRR
jgi:uncharacterized LabA/DUF88 family protein